MHYPLKKRNNEENCWKLKPLSLSAVELFALEAILMTPQCSTPPEFNEATHQLDKLDAEGSVPTLKCLTVQDLGFMKHHFIPICFVLFKSLSKNETVVTNQSKMPTTRR